MFRFVQGRTSSLGRKYIMAVTGMVLGIFLLIHAAGNSFFFQGKAAFNAYAEHLHSLGALIPISEILLVAIFLLHVLIGITLFLNNRDAGGGRYAVNKSFGGRTWGSRTMPWTGAVILSFLLLHLFNFRFVVHAVSVADTVTTVLGTPFVSLFYFFGVTALGLHITHGFWSIFQSVGVNHPKYNGLLRGGAYLLSALINIIFLGVILLIGLETFVL
ncbi:MAG: succinate dehydrogenase [Candidatus Electrothrix sp. AR4]|nr:succinate dehydrogenase [Candidatus Electrothrix sp. AR4]